MHKSMHRILVFLISLLVLFSSWSLPESSGVVTARSAPVLQVLSAFGGSGYAYIQCKVLSDGGNNLNGCGIRVRLPGGAWGASGTGYFTDEETYFSATKSGLNPRELYEIQGFVRYLVGGITQYTYTEIIQIRTEGLAQTSDFTIVSTTTNSATGSIFIVDDGYAPPITKVEFTIYGVNGSAFKTAVMKIAPTGTSLPLGLHTLTSYENLQIYTEYDAYITVTNHFSPAISGPIRFRTKPLVPAVTTSSLVIKLPAGDGLYNATLRGTVDDGNDLPDPVPISERGIVCGLSATPTIENSTKVTMGSELGSYAATVTGLSYGVQYYYRAYAINSGGVGYGSIRSLIASAVVSPSPVPTPEPRPSATPTPLVKPTTSLSTTKIPARTTLATTSPAFTDPGVTTSPAPTTLPGGVITPTTAAVPGETTGVAMTPTAGPATGGSNTIPAVTPTTQVSSGQPTGASASPAISQQTSTHAGSLLGNTDKGSEETTEANQPRPSFLWIWILTAAVLTGTVVILVLRKRRK